MVQVRVHRNLNDHTPDGSAGWVITPKGGKSYRVASALVSISSVKVSASALDRIRTPRGSLTKSGAKGLGRRTVGAWLVGELVEIPTKRTGFTVHFNPFQNDTFMIQKAGVFKPLEVSSDLILSFNQDGSVEVRRS